MGIREFLIAAATAAGFDITGEAAAEPPREFSRFETAVSEAADSYYIDSWRVTGPNSVEVDFYSHSRKSSFPGYFDFDLDSGACLSYQYPYRDANQPKFFIDRMHAKLNDG